MVDNTHELDLADTSFGAVILHLILAVASDPDAALRAVAGMRVPDGRAVIFDQFVADAGPISLRRRLADPMAVPLATDVTRRLAARVAASGFAWVHREDGGFCGFF